MSNLEFAALAFLFSLAICLVLFGLYRFFWGSRYNERLDKAFNRARYFRETGAGSRSW